MLSRPDDAKPRNGCEFLGGRSEQIRFVLLKVFKANRIHIFNRRTKPDCPFNMWRTRFKFIWQLA